VPNAPKALLEEEREQGNHLENSRSSGGGLPASVQSGLFSRLLTPKARSDKIRWRWIYLL